MSFGVLVGFDGAALIFLASALFSMRGTDPVKMRDRAQLYDAQPIWLFAITMAVLAIVLIAVTVETNGKGAPVETKITPLATLAIAWFFSNMVFALHYAHMYYRNSNGQDAGGLELPDGEPPTYIDFCYFSFVIGMTFQVSDIDITSRDIRAASLVHSLIAFFFNVGVIALSVNIVAGN
ncbi:MAG: DUF1345 domain-containing protein [Rhodobacteraceae bacterium]|nr:DUF1345 domain-containing protein [Paracoccaceae bacterium]